MAVLIFQGLAPKLVLIACRFEPNWLFIFCNFLIFVIGRSETFDAKSPARHSLQQPRVHSAGVSVVWVRKGFGGVAGRSEDSRGGKIFGLVVGCLLRSEVVARMELTP